jgi:YihY family inner membrane protein
VLGLPIGVVYKYVDDQGAYLAAIITYYAFVAILPLLLLGTTTLGVLLQDNPDLEEQVLDSALAQFPVIGTELGIPGGLSGSATAVVLGSLAALYGALGLGQAIQNATNVAWAVPRNKRPNPVLVRLKSLLLLLVGGLALLAVSSLSITASETEVLGASLASYRWPIVLATVFLNTVVLTFFFRLAAARRHSLRSAMPGAFFVAVAWQAVQRVGTFYVQQVLDSTSEMNQTFGLVLGLVGILFLGAVTGVLGIELNVVLERRFWPRALLTPFTDAVELTEADRRAYAAYARAQRHKGFETVEVTFDGIPAVRPRVGSGDDEGQRSGTNR